MEKPIKDYDNYHDNRSDKIKYVPKDWATSPFDLLGSAENLDSVSLRGDLLRTEIHSGSPLDPRNRPFHGLLGPLKRPDGTDKQSES